MSTRQTDNITVSSVSIRISSCKWILSTRKCLLSTQAFNSIFFDNHDFMQLTMIATRCLIGTSTWDILFAFKQDYLFGCYVGGRSCYHRNKLYLTFLVIRSHNNEKSYEYASAVEEVNFLKF